MIVFIIIMLMELMMMLSAGTPDTTRPPASSVPLVATADEISHIILSYVTGYKRWGRRGRGRSGGNKWGI